VALTTHYKSEVISEHFGDGRDFGVDIEYFAEDEPLGTAGGLSLVPDTDEPLLVMNGDILTRVNFRALLDFHREHEAAMTVCVRQEELKLPYGLVEADGEAVTGIDEKPTITHFINAGIYLIDPVARPYVPRGTAFEMPDLVARLIEHGLPVVRFPLREYWVDIGLTETYEQAGRDHAEGRVG
jgi:NDP-sugar pyrophosphorylase family protein